MNVIKRYRRPLSVAVILAVLDLAVRIGSGFDMGVIVPTEAVLFLGAAILLGWMSRNADASDPGTRRLDSWLAACLALAAIRAALWATGVDVYTANLVILAIGLAAVALLLYRRRRS